MFLESSSSSFSSSLRFNCLKFPSLMSRRVVFEFQTLSLARVCPSFCPSLFVVTLFPSFKSRIGWRKKLACDILHFYLASFTCLLLAIKFHTHNRYRRDIMMFATRRDEMMRETRYQNLWELIVNNDDICFKHILPRLRSNGSIIAGDGDEKVD